MIRDGEPVLRIIPSANDQVRVQTRNGEYLARSVVVTAGAWANKILQTVGLQLPLQVGHSVYTGVFRQGGFRVQTPGNESYLNL